MSGDSFGFLQDRFLAQYGSTALSLAETSNPHIQEKAFSELGRFVERVIKQVAEKENVSLADLTKEELRKPGRILDCIRADPRTNHIAVLLEDHNIKEILNRRNSSVHDDERGSNLQRLLEQLPYRIDDALAMGRWFNQQYERDVEEFNYQLPAQPVQSARPIQPAQPTRLAAAPTPAPQPYRVPPRGQRPSDFIRREARERFFRRLGAGLVFCFVTFFLIAVYSWIASFGTSPNSAKVASGPPVSIIPNIQSRPRAVPTISQIQVGRRLAAGRLDAPGDEFMAPLSTVAAVVSYNNATPSQSKLRVELAVGSGTFPCGEQLASYVSGVISCTWEQVIPAGEHSIYAYIEGIGHGRRFTVTGQPAASLPTIDPRPEATQPKASAWSAPPLPPQGPRLAKITSVEFGNFNMYGKTIFPNTVRGPLEHLSALISYSNADITRDTMEAYLSSPKGRFPCDFSPSPLLQVSGERTCGWTGVGPDAYKITVLINGKVAAQKSITVLAKTSPPPSAALTQPKRSAPRLANPSPSKAEEEFRKELSTPGCELLRRDGFDATVCVQGHINSDGALVGPGYME
ncbi:hypothetical protein KMZ93_04330 [Bradyrhizobium sediminis]|uniref:Uncharacterized protein n=1 Tax=Bradyrhizobium sediminis TaxID=2840469 RepID=A0A975RYG6_9BRAD|nr:hypothetical protein [Bradyrhizobium sediminis]QWG24163.1 hypothetical protein KMZ93_04330 [Bradyrhizobium sediminis]